MNICVIGGGNIGTQFACKCASKGHHTNLYCSEPQLFDGTLEIVDEFENITIGKLNKVTSDLEDAMSGCDFVFVSYPAFLLKVLADQMLPFINKGITICVLPGTGGAEFAFRECIESGASLVGIQRVPSVARIEIKGKRVRCEGIRPELFLGAIPNSAGAYSAQLLSELWDIPCNVLPNYLSVTLTPSNPILHTTRLATLFSDYENGKIYVKNPLFYGEWTDESSELLLKCDEELQKLLLKLDELDLSKVISLKRHYESQNVKEMTAKIRSIKSLHELKSPMKKLPNGWIPDFDSRYFTADFPYGLAIIEELADIIGFFAPNIHKTMDWYRKVTGNNNRLELSQYGISSKKDIYILYSTK